MPISAVLARARDRLWGAVTRATGVSAHDDWELVRAGESGARWRRDDETLACRPLGGGYVVTVGRDRGRNRFQLTPGAVPLSSALTIATLYLSHGLAPQTDRGGRPFVGVRHGRPTQVFDPEAGGPSVSYTYLDGATDLSEFPEFLRVREDVRRVSRALPETRRREPRSAEE